MNWIATCFRKISQSHAADKQHDHRGEQRPALALLANCLAKQNGHPCADHEDRQHLDIVCERRRIFERMCRVHIKEPAAIRAEHLD